MVSVTFSTSTKGYLGTSLPTDAVEIAYDGNTGRSGWLNLSFESSSQSMEEFLSNFCGGKLHQNYDPFQAIDIGEPRDGAYLIDMRDTSYYSYSPEVADTTFGIRCLGQDQIQIVVDKSNSEKYSMRMEILFNCTKCRVT
jgi:hypothetical protein